MSLLHALNHDVPNLIHRRQFELTTYLLPNHSWSRFLSIEPNWHATHPSCYKLQAFTTFLTTFHKMIKIFLLLAIHSWELPHWPPSIWKLCFWLKSVILLAWLGKTTVSTYSLNFNRPKKPPKWESTIFTWTKQSPDAPTNGLWKTSGTARWPT